MALRNMAENEKIIHRLLQSVANKTVSHAYVFEADRCMDKLSLAQNFVKAVLCRQEEADACDQCVSCKKVDHGNHEDVFYIHADGGSIKDEAIEDLQNCLKKKPLSGDRNVAIINGADAMTLRAQNRFLKTLEEPTPGTLILLLSENVENLIKTILSRCVVIHLNTATTDEMEEYREGASCIGELLLKRSPYYKTIKEIEPFTESRENAYHFLDALERWFRDLMLSPFDEEKILLIEKDRMEKFRQLHRIYDMDKVYLIIDAIEAARKELKQNINVSYALKHMVLETF
ncbi:hypothetical protein [Sinanaerobacter sp. ZZT-01]|uniref:hypothetical protein n=1 Tax=Sinanaerobacter sp. ZZT-01 TaxID=3111540 RepID=UPI002D7881FF|nr:hypothetical protein [Sinanaerobacter sp. ZZT-01]WRR92202.1 hypothetical protein U5921_08990 [Sinanaerobacter sp. ZZT-01]